MSHLDELAKQVLEQEKKRRADLHSELDPADAAEFQERLNKELSQEVIEALGIRVTGWRTGREPYKDRPEPRANFSLKGDFYTILWYEKEPCWELFGSLRRIFHLHTVIQPGKLRDDLLLLYGWSQEA